jgi:hypothetical protein
MVGEVRVENEQNAHALEIKLPELVGLAANELPELDLPANEITETDVRDQDMTLKHDQPREMDS